MENIFFKEIFSKKNNYVFVNILFVLAMAIFTINCFSLSSFGFTGLLKALIIPLIILLSGVLVLNRDFFKDIDWRDLPPILSFKTMGLFLLFFSVAFIGLNLLNVQVHIPLVLLLIVLSSGYLLMLYFEFSGRLDRAVYVFFLCFSYIDLSFIVMSRAEIGKAKNTFFIF